MIETRNEALARQQVILSFLGYYRGNIDGIWGPKSFDAKRAFETSGKFHPGVPSKGNPLSLTERLPNGIYRDASAPGRGLLTAAGLTAEKIAAITEGSKVTQSEEDAPEPEVENKIQSPVRGETFAVLPVDESPYTDEQEQDDQETSELHLASNENYALGSDDLDDADDESQASSQLPKFKQKKKKNR